MADDLWAGVAIWLDSERRNPDSEINQFVVQKANDVADAERFYVPKRSGRTLASIHVEGDVDSDGYPYQKVLSGKLISNINASSTGFIRNRHSRIIAKRFAKPDTERIAVPFQRYAVESVEAMDAATVIE